MKTRIRMGMKPTAKGVCNLDVTVDAELENEETAKDVGEILNEAVVEFKKQVTELGYKNLEVE